MPAAPELASIPEVELIRTGSWAIQSGKWDATRDDLSAAVAALACPAVRKPILKIGHSDKRFEVGDGQPAIGWVDNMRLADGGHTLVGDFAGMPAWLANPDSQGRRVISSAYPDRSVEGLYSYKCQIGHTHPFVLTAVALLGVTEPGVGTLKSLQDVQTLYRGVAAEAAEHDGAVAVCAAIPANPQVEEGAVPSPKPSLADRVRAAWNATAPVEQWIAEVDEDSSEVVVCDDKTRTRLRVSVVAHDDGRVTFGEPQPVAASRVVFASRDESRPDVPAASPQPPAEPDGTNPESEEEDSLMASTLTSDIRSRLGLTEDADEAAVLAALDQRLKAGQPTPTDPPTDPAPEPAEPAVPAEPAPVEPVKELVNASAGADLLRQQYEEMSKELAVIKAARAADERTAYFDAVVKAGKITPAARATWEKRYDDAPAVIRDILDATADGAAVPVHASGYTGSPDTDGVDTEYASLEAALYPENMRLSGRSA